MIGNRFEDGSQVIAAVPEVLDLLTTVERPRSRLLDWVVLVDRGPERDKRWATALVHGIQEYAGSRFIGYRVPGEYSHGKCFTHEIEAYEDMLRRAGIMDENQTDHR